MTTVTLRSALALIPDIFRDQLLSEYEQSQQAAVRGDWEKVGLKAGKICEIVYGILEGICTGTFPASISKPSNMVDACRVLETRAVAGTPRSARIQIPRVISALYELRNNRAIGHAGGDVLPNQMDGLFFNQSIKWIIAELVRLSHNASVEDAQKIVEQVSIRWSAAVWESDSRKRIILEGLDRDERLLALLYFSDLRVSIDDLRSWLSVSNITNFKNRQLQPLHEADFIDFDPSRGIINLLPKGIRAVEEKLSA